MGETGGSWTETLPGRLDELAGQWRLRLGRALPGGSTSYVVTALTESGEERVMKVVVPGQDPTAEAHALRLAAGRGHALLHAYDADRGALLLEALGPSLDRAPLPVEEALRTLADTLATAWTVPAPDLAPVDKAAGLLTLIDQLSPAVPVPGRVLDHARRLAHELSDSFDPAGAVLVHGDPHPANLLAVKQPRPGAGSGYVFVDPDGFRADPTYDLGVTVRDWSRRVLEAPSDQAARSLVRGWCELLGEHAGHDPERIWSWGLLERVTSGLFISDFGAVRLGRTFLDSAERLVD